MGRGGRGDASSGAGESYGVRRERARNDDDDDAGEGGWGSRRREGGRRARGRRGGASGADRARLDAAREGGAVARRTRRERRGRALAGPRARRARTRTRARPPADDERRQRSTARGEGDDGRGSARAGDGRGARARADAAGPALRGAASDEGDVPSEQHRASARRPGCGEGVVGGGDKRRRIRAGARGADDFRRHTRWFCCLRSGPPVLSPTRPLPSPTRSSGGGQIRDARGSAAARVLSLARASAPSRRRLWRVGTPRGSRSRRRARVRPREVFRPADTPHSPPEAPRRRRFRRHGVLALEPRASPRRRAGGLGAAPPPARPLPRRAPRPPRPRRRRRRPRARPARGLARPATARSVRSVRVGR